MREDQCLKSAQDCNSIPGLSAIGSIGGDKTYREPTTKEVLIHRAEEHRRQAHALETLARELPEGGMSALAEKTLLHTIGSGLH